jgi:hypothetical protein
MPLSPHIEALHLLSSSLLKHPESNCFPAEIEPGLTTTTIFYQRASFFDVSLYIIRTFPWRENSSLGENSGTNKAAFVKECQIGLFRFILCRVIGIFM